MRKNNTILQQLDCNTPYYNYHTPVMRTMRLEPNKLKISITAMNATSKRLSDADADDSESVESSTDFDFFQTCPLGSGFELDCWQNKTTPTVSKRTGAKSERGNSSFDDDPDDFDWGDTSSFSSVEAQAVSSTSADEDDHNAENHDNSDSLPTTMSGYSVCPPSDPQVPKEETTRREEEPTKNPTVENQDNCIIAAAVHILEPHFQAAVDHISGRHVHFGTTVVTTEFTYEKPSNDDFFRLYYSAHELQRLQDQYKIDASSGKIQSSDNRTADVLPERVDDSEDDEKQFDYCPDYPSW